MKTFIKNTILTGAFFIGALAMPGTATAQNTSTGYFLDDYTYRFQSNPAFGNSKNFISIPTVGNINVHENGNIGAGDIFFNVNGRTTTFMHPGVSAAEVMANIKDVNRLGTDISLPVIATGFKSFGGYSTIALNVRASAGLNLPRSIFSLLKEGVTNQTYDIKDVNGFGTSYAELSIGHSHDISSELRIGANVKLLLGAGNVSMDLTKAQLTLGTDSWSVTSQGEVNANVKGLYYKTDVNSTTGHRYVNGVDVDGGGIAGFGAAVDLGAVYTPAALSDLTISASLLDLGFINWNTNVVASTNGERNFSTDRYTFNVDGDAPNSFKKEWEKLKNDFASVYELDDLGDRGSQTRGLGATMNIGAQYRLPVYRRLSFGVLNTTRFHGDYSWTEFRASANWAPSRVFDAALSASTGTFGTSFGWLANLHCTGFNFFIGMDNVPTKMSKDGVPLCKNSSVNLGLNILF